jgi:hypothetical protein
MVVHDKLCRPWLLIGAYVHRPDSAEASGIPPARGCMAALDLILKVFCAPSLQAPMQL